jgi:hypothetical protein
MLTHAQYEHSPDITRMWEMDMMMHQKYTAKSMIAPRGGAPGMELRTAGRANSTVTAPVTNAATSTCKHIDKVKVRQRNLETLLKLYQTGPHRTFFIPL